MCGIYALLSSSSPAAGDVPGDFLDGIDRLVGMSSGDDTGVAEATGLLDDLLKTSYGLVACEGFLAVLRDRESARSLERAYRRLESWVGSLESAGRSGGFRDQGATERLNHLIVGARDLAWRIERDVLANIAPVLALLGALADDDAIPVLAHAWSLNVVLDNLDRLEVRGRDSAGLAIYAHFADGEAADRFFDGLEAELGEELSRRSAPGATRRDVIVLPETSERVALFTFKVADEVGEMGDNVRALRDLIAADRIFQRALREPGVELQILAHTRWASNGVVSVPNCHPVDSSIWRDDEPIAGSRGTFVAALNGDIDNFQQLHREYVVDAGLRLDEGVTTDAKIIPIVVRHHFERTKSLGKAFHDAFQELEGSMAIALMSADRPGEFLFGQKGSGQGLYFGLSKTATCAASEMYGVVELTPTYVKAEGESVDGGETFVMRRGKGGPDVWLLAKSAPRRIPDKRRCEAEITTRDINRGEYARFFLKEISESVDSVRKTLRGKYEVGEGGAVEFHLGDDVLDPERLQALRDGAIRRIVTIGQGTAAIAGTGIVALLERALDGTGCAVQVQGLKATELSAHHLRDDMSDTLVIAVSQSGTTTDTNRTVDMVKERGAWVVGIVNRRNSDLVYKSHGVLYTSDGRDIEMSVASTKAFYAQNVAGQVLALALARALGVADARIAEELQALDRLPDAMARTLELGDRIRDLASQLATRRNHWAVVGSGLDKIAASEIRIKLSELCYKSIACDFTEDKKHIDLSSEPLVIVCANSAPESMIPDLVKEVAIFRAHQSLPIVIVPEGEDRFDPYAAGVLKLPRQDPPLGYLLTTMVGHLFGYHAANAFDGMAKRLRSIRTSLMEELEPVPAVTDGDDGDALAEPALSDETIARVRDFNDLLVNGALDGCLTPAAAIRIATIFQSILWRGPRAGAASLEPGEVLRSLTGAINELARPIDAIKHQAKTVTVGISRAEEVPEGLLLTTLRELEAIDLAHLSERHHRFLAAFEPVVEQVAGVTVYRVAGLDAVGRPRRGSAVEVVAKSGCAEKILSRCESGAPLAGTKWGVVRRGEVYLGCGQLDCRKILIVPVIGEQQHGHLVLFHLELSSSATPRQRFRALSAHRSRLEQLRIAVTERSLEWKPELLQSVDTDALFFGDPEAIAEELEAKAGEHEPKNR